MLNFTIVIIHKEMKKMESFKKRLSSLNGKTFNIKTFAIYYNFVLTLFLNYKML